MKKYLLALLLLLLPAVLGAQGPAVPVIAPDTPAIIEFDYGNTTGVGFSAVVDNQIVKNFTDAELTINGTTVRATIPGVARGAHKLKIRAYSKLSPSLVTDSAELDFVADAVPAAPGVPRFIVAPGSGPGEFVVELRGFQTPNGTPVSETVLKLPTIK